MHFKTEFSYLKKSDIFVSVKLTFYFGHRMHTSEEQLKFQPVLNVPTPVKQLQVIRRKDNFVGKIDLTWLLFTIGQMRISFLFWDVQAIWSWCGHLKHIMSQKKIIFLSFFHSFFLSFSFYNNNYSGILIGINSFI
jgi:hypothetical protein